MRPRDSVGAAVMRAVKFSSGCAVQSLLAGAAHRSRTHRRADRRRTRRGRSTPFTFTRPTVIAVRMLWLRLERPVRRSPCSHRANRRSRYRSRRRRGRTPSRAARTHEVLGGRPNAHFSFRRGTSAAREARGMARALKAVLCVFTPQPFQAGTLRRLLERRIRRAAIVHLVRVGGACRADGAGR